MICQDTDDTDRDLPILHTGLTKFYVPREDGPGPGVSSTEDAPGPHSPRVETDPPAAGDSQDT